MNQQLLEELTAADAQGERVLASLWPGDSFYYRGKFHEIKSMQWDTDGRFIFLRTTEEVGKPYEIKSHGETQIHQPVRSFHFDGALIFPALLTDEHFAAENSTTETW